MRLFLGVNVRVIFNSMSAELRYMRMTEVMTEEAVS